MQSTANTHEAPQVRAVRAYDIRRFLRHVRNMLLVIGVVVGAALFLESLANRRLRVAATRELHQLGVYVTRDLHDVGMAGPELGDEEFAAASHLLLAGGGPERLDVSRASISDRSCELLARMRRLRWLDIGRTRITDEGLATLASLENLEELYLTSNNISDVGLAHLARLTNLKYVFAVKTQVTDEGIRELRKHLPNVVIER